LPPLAAAGLLLAAAPALALEPAPPWLRVGPHTVYDGVTDDLVTGGRGADAMLGKRPGYADPLHPTAAELRRAALFQLGSAGQGFGKLFGPDVDETPDDGRRAWPPDASAKHAGRMRFGSFAASPKHGIEEFSFRRPLPGRPLGKKEPRRLLPQRD
jgi:hypothetical protein